MTYVTRHALRVYAALAGLKPSGTGDVIDALIPFLEPILEVMHNKIYDPELVVLGVRRLYNWRFNRDVAEQFAGRLLSKGYLKRAAANVFTVNFEPKKPYDGQIEIATVLERVADEFEGFPPKITDLFQFSLTRTDLKDALIKFLVSLDAYTEEAFAEQIERLTIDVDKSTLLHQLEEGGKPLPQETKYLCARFVKHLARNKPEFLPHLARLASIGLLTEVVEDFVRPTTPVAKCDLTAILDAPVALTLLGLSGRAAQDDIVNVVDSLRSIDCSFIVFPVSCEEMTRNLASMLKLNPLDRHGPTHDAMRKREVDEDFVRSVMNNPERALQTMGVTVRPMGIDNFPSGVRYFDQSTFQDFLAGITWKQSSIDAREHDAICTALTMRLRAGTKSSDLLNSKFVMITTNPVFVRYAREFCRRSMMINERQIPPVISQRELATTAWLRTGLAARTDDKSAADIPRAHLMASCEKVLRTRSEVTQAVHQKLRDFAPEKITQYELLLADHRSVQRLMDETLGDEHLVTAENAERLLDEMRRATASELESEWQRKYRQQAQRLGSQTKAAKAEAAAALDASRSEAEAAINAKAVELAEKEALLVAAEEERARLERELQAARRRDHVKLTNLIRNANRVTRRVELAMLALLGVIVAGAFVGSTFELTSKHLVFWIVAGLVGLVGLYYLVQDIRQKPKFGFENILNWIAHYQVTRGLRRIGLEDSYHRESILCNYGKLSFRYEPREGESGQPR